jgi:hypothetical protein
MSASGGYRNATGRQKDRQIPRHRRRLILTWKIAVSVVGAYPAATKIGSLLFDGKKWVRSLSSIANMCSRVVSHNLNL